MLVLSRRQGERVVLDTPLGKVVVVIHEILPGGRVRIGIDAPHQIEVLRYELTTRKHDERGES